MSLTPSKVIRRGHLYLALFLTPWMIIYALSGLVLNHNAFVRSLYGENFSRFEKVGDQEYAGAFSADADPRLIGAQILEHLGLAGTFNVQGGPNAAKLVINRNGPFAQHRVTYLRAENRLLIEKQAFTAPVFLNRAHFRHGYEQPFLAAQAWALILDLVIVAMLFWVVSGIWMWWDLRPTRAWGAACALLGFGLFGTLLATI